MTPEFEAKVFFFRKETVSFLPQSPPRPLPVPCGFVRLGRGVTQPGAPVDFSKGQS